MIEAIKIAKATKKALPCDGINLVQSNEKAAQQDIFHFHLHIKPRWYDDNVSLHWDTTPVNEEVKMSTLEKLKSTLI